MVGPTWGDAFDITPSDTVNLKAGCTGIYVGGTGALTIETLTGQIATFAAVPVGTTISIQARKVRATGTTATLLLGLIA